MLCPLLKPFRSFEKSQRNVIKRWVTLTVSQLQLNRWLAHLFKNTNENTNDIRRSNPIKETQNTIGGL